MKKISLLVRTGICLAGLAILLASCSSTPPPVTEPAQDATSESKTSSTAEKKAKTIVVRIPRVVKETVQFPDGTEDEYTLYTYSPDGKHLMKEELFDAASGDLLEIRQYRYDGDRLIEKQIVDGQGKPKGRRAYRYENGLLSEEAQFDKKDNLQARLLYTYDSRNRKIEWKTLDGSGSVVGISRYFYDDGGTNPVRVELYGPGETLELVISISYTEGKRAREVYKSPDGRLEKEVVYRYDEQGRLLGETTYSSTKAKIGSRAYEYPSDSMVPAREIHLNGRDKPMKVLVYEYAYREEKRVIYE